MPFIMDQQRFQNTTGHPLSYAAINGATMPKEGVIEICMNIQP